MTYRDAGVDIDATSSAVGRIAERARTMLGATGAADIGHFGGMYRLPSGPDRLLVASADGVGTKLKLAFLLGGDAHARMGEDLVNHCVNDILALGARPLFFLDYFSTGHFDQAVFDGFVSGLVAGCAANGMALIGGETAEMPGMYASGEYDAAGFIVGEVSPDQVIDGSDVRPGDVLLGLPSGGLQTNGFSLARRIAGLSGAAEDADADRARLSEPLPGDESVTVGEALIVGHATFRPAVAPLAAREDRPVRGMVHVTGGGLVDNVPRILADDLAAEIDPSAWTVPPVLTWLTMAGDVPFRERYRAFNMGIGFVVVVRSEDVDEILSGLPGAVPIGRVVRRPNGAGQVLGLD